MEKILIIDSHSLLHRAFHALPPLKTKKGEIVNAIYGFYSIFLRALNEIRPDFVAATFDVAGPTFRHKEFENYKAKRPVHSEEFYQQVGRVKEILKDFGVKVFEKQGFEADDIIGTIKELVSKKQIFPKIEIIILSGDLDTLQLVDSQTKVWTMKKGIKDTIFYTPEEVGKKYPGLRPEQMIDFRGLKGDPSDNIPGVTGIGEKGALKLIQEFGSLENIYKDIEEKGEKSEKLKPVLRKKLEDYKEQAFLSKKLSEIEKNTPIDFKLEDCRFGGFDRKKIAEIFNELEFFSLISRLPKADGIDLAELSNKGKDEEVSEKIEQLFKEKVFSQKIYEMEKKLIPAIKEMEENGIKIDPEVLSSFSQKLENKIKTLEQGIFKIAGSDFNLNSPQQVSDVLFSKLGISSEAIKKTPGGVLSTGVDELKKMEARHPIIKLMLEYREVFKLKSGFVDSLAKLMDEKDLKIHPNFHQLGTETGRMSCSEPNLQNIPTKTELGKEVRKCFVAENGFVFLSADYSQMELRIAASLANDEKLIKFFLEEKDIHRAMAAEVFQLPENEITEEQRTSVKVLNFGILYGMGAKAFSQNAEISFKEAKEFIKKYFEEFSTLSEYRKKLIGDAQKNGFVETYFGRKRFLSEINSIDKRLKSQAERMAISTKIQGTASDVIKMAMVELFEKKVIDKDCKIILQLHDELVFEVKESRMLLKAKEIKKIMEKITNEESDFKVPLKVKIEIGKNWGTLEKYDKIQ